MDCSNCGAPLPAKSNVCRYCETLNEVDLRTVRRTARARGTGERACPRCARPMTVVAAAGVDLDRCPACHGIFFDPDELERVLETSVRPAAEADLAELNRLIDEEFPETAPDVRYVPCPDCAKLMNRKAHAARAGVVVDRCREHGVWLDGGELRRLAKWARAGGLDRARELAEEKARLDERAATAVPSALDARLRSMDPDARARAWGVPGSLAEAGDAVGILDLLAHLIAGR